MAGDCGDCVITTLNVSSLTKRLDSFFNPPTSLCTCANRRSDLAQASFHFPPPAASVTQHLKVQVTGLTPVFQAASTQASQYVASCALGQTRLCVDLAIMRFRLTTPESC